MEWLEFHQVVPGDVRLQMWLAFGFLLVCLLNTVGLLLAKFLRRSGEIGVRRALGASRAEIFKQCLVEAGTIGAGRRRCSAWCWRCSGCGRCASSPAEYAQLAHLDRRHAAADLRAGHRRQPARRPAAGLARDAGARRRCSSNRNDPRYAARQLTPRRIPMEIRPILSTLRRHKTAAALIVLEIALTCAIICNALFLIAQPRWRRLNMPSGMAEHELIVRPQLTGIGTQDDGNAARPASDLAALRAIPGVKPTR